MKLYQTLNMFSEEGNVISETISEDAEYHLFINKKELVLE
jgi:hypothetical protein